MLKLTRLSVFLLTVLFTGSLQAQKITLNLKGVEIGTLIQMVSEVTKKNFVVDERVKGKVTVISATPMDDEELYQVFLSILSVHRFAAIPSGKVVKIVPEAVAKTQSLPVIEDAGANKRGDEVVTRVVEVEHISASQLIPVLRPLIPQQGHIAAYPANNTLIVSDRAANVARLQEIIRRIDQPEQHDIDVIVLEHASAAETVRLLATLDKKPGKAGSPRGIVPVYIADERTNSVLISGNRAQRLRLKALIAHLDTPLKTVGNTRVVFLRYARAEDLASVLQGISDSMKESGRASNRTAKGLPVAVINTNIQADSSTNSLIITATPDVLESLQAVIRQLDIRRAQVLVEAVIAEIETSKVQELGVQWFVDGTPDGTGPLGISDLGPGTGITSLASDVINGYTPNFTGFGDGAVLGLGRFNSSSINFAAVLRALAADASANILSTPTLVMLDNQEAEIVVGKVVPFLTGQYTNTGAASGSVNPFQTIKRENVGLTLRVKPQINEGDTIQLEIYQEVSSVSESEVVTSDVVTQKRTIKTVVMAENGNMVVLGGLLDESLTDTTQKVPGLGDLPLIGALFRYQKAKKEKRNLMVFLHPVILRDSAIESRVSGGKYNKMRASQLAFQQKGVPFTDKADIPVLPELNDFLTVLPDDGRPVSILNSE
ncbi:MAG: type II secretion system secretin GspD [Gammaproteobacteria bacterium]|nr:type II secretion system secretin GspD [Gammaproteobacteria bacterium]